MMHSQLLDNWQQDLPGLSDDRLRERIAFARLRAMDAEGLGLLSRAKARRMWREKRDQAQAELARRELTQQRGRA
jgi:hypothetical protein